MATNSRPIDFDANMINPSHKNIGAAATQLYACGSFCKCRGRSIVFRRSTMRHVARGAASASTRPPLSLHHREEAGHELVERDRVLAHAGGVVEDAIMDASLAAMMAEARQPSPRTRRTPAHVSGGNTTQ
jgi:hypothetical protein